MNYSSLSSSISGNSTLNEEISLKHITVILAINIVFGLPIYSYIIWFNFKQRLENEFFFFNLALNDAVFCLGCLLSVVNSCFSYVKFVKTVMFFGSFLQVGRPLFQGCICIERYMAVVHPIIFLQYKSLRYKTAGTAVVWVIVVSYAIFLIIALDADLLHLAFHLLLVLYIIIFPVKVFCCLMVLKVLKQAGPSERKKEKRMIQKSKIKAFRIILRVLLFSLVTYIPTVTALSLFNVLGFKTFSTVWSICLYIVIIGGILHALTYVSKSASLPFCKNF